ncbi:MAG: response regulator [Pseudolabrys sp.]|jgi:CheY-like chemotaxis protein
MTNPPLASRTKPPRILIVEDDLVIALMIEEIVRELGYAVSGVAGTIATTRLQIAKRDFDAVLLDIDLAGEHHPETADILLEAGVPFAFVTGYDYVLEPRHEGVPLLEKPFGTVELLVLLEKLVGPGSLTSETE